MTIRRRPSFLLLLLLLLGALALACGGGALPAPPAPPPPKPRNAADIARDIVGGRVSALVHVGRLRGHALAARLAALDPWGPVLDGTGIDPQRDFERAFVTAPDTEHEDDMAFVAEHTLGEARARAAVDALVARSSPPGAWLEGLGVSAARVTVRGRTRVVALVEPNVLVVLPDRYARHAARFAGTAGCPLPTGVEAVLATADDPSRTLRGPGVPELPPTLLRAEATLVPAADGGADLHVEAPSSSPEQAGADAATLTDRGEKLTSIDVVSLLKLRLFEPVVFRAQGTTVTADRHLTPNELDRIESIVRALLPK
ncbi:MAG: hypothetical protein HY744_09635 [Deltaproteobacteria bacterium]|nr:hypothetical protein [Deltaproteobacteria bacterium]